MQRFSVAFIGLFLVLGARATTYSVHPNGSGNFPDIQSAIDGALDGDTIVLGNGTFIGPGNRGIDFRGKAITVRSQHGPEYCKIHCQEYDRCIKFT